MESLYRELGMERRGVFVFSAQPGDDGADAYSRMFGLSVVEDPATGSASGPLGCYLVRHGVVSAEKGRHLESVQGVKMKRPSRIHIEIGTEGSEIVSVRVGGESVLVGSGTLAVGATAAG
jgi:trans-2,3-dihydro-3-hydroxyanthranilate isomerase